MKKADRSKQLKRTAKLAKRKAKLAKEKKRNPAAAPSLIYRGTKYQTDEFTQLVYATESGIFEAHEESGRRLVDRDVTVAIETVIRRLRKNAPLKAETLPDSQDEGDAEVLIRAILAHWEPLGSMYSREQRIGVLRTLLGSIEIWSQRGPSRRGYLSFLEGFLGRIDPGSLTAGGGEETELVEIGRQWLRDNDGEARREFMGLAESYQDSGRSAELAQNCRQLIGEFVDTASPGLFEIMSVSAALEYSDAE